MIATFDWVKVSEPEITRLDKISIFVNRILAYIA